MATNSNSRANPSWEAMDFAFLRNFVVKFSNCSTSLNPSRVMFDVNMDESKVDEIYENKRSFYLRHVGNSFIVVASTTNSEMEA
uniref:Uncharacterized protein n=1 Tax=Cannabis sativa TaxID=3483 RepID=A0A803R938_CANSA